MDKDGEYGVRSGGLVVHVGGGGGAVEGAVLEALHRLVGRHHGAGGHADLRGETVREKSYFNDPFIRCRLICFCCD